MGFFLLTGLILLFAGLMPSWKYSKKWGYKPSGVVCLFLMVVVLLIYMDVVRFAYF